MRGALAACCRVLRRVARADAGWFESGDTQLRIDLQLLNDAEVIRLPVNQWPIAARCGGIRARNAKEHFATNSAVIAALERVRARTEIRAGRPRLAFDTGIRGGEPGLRRDFDTLAREDGELGARREATKGDASRSGLDVTGSPIRPTATSCAPTDPTPPCNSATGC